MDDMPIKLPVEGAARGGGRSHNALGQRLGRKGRDTRERILTGMQRLLAAPADTIGSPLSLTAVAREASVGIATLYLYFADMSELLQATLEPLNAEIDLLRERFDYRWPDASLVTDCQMFLEAHHLFWAKHSRLLHCRNALADNGDRRMLEYRRAMSHPLIACLDRQLQGQSLTGGSQHWSYAVVLLTMLERMATITTDETFALTLMATFHEGGRAAFVHETLCAQAKIIALTIRDRR